MSGRGEPPWLHAPLGCKSNERRGLCQVKRARRAADPGTPVSTSARRAADLGTPVPTSARRAADLGTPVSTSARRAALWGLQRLVLSLALVNNVFGPSLGGLIPPGFNYW